MYWTILGDFWKTEPGNDCPSAEVIVTAGNCRRAATALGLSYEGQEDANPFISAGCFFTDSTVKFNELTDPEKTKPWEVFGGICLKGIFVLL